MVVPEYEIASPGAQALIESLRAVGYSLPTAVADIVDNSIAAGADNVWLDLHWSGRESRVAVLDDGCGMPEKVLFNAMRPGSQSPLADRDETDLGRFGLGLKTASFSQCRSLSVVSKAAGHNVACRRWDLDFVAKHDEWRLLKEVSSQAGDAAEELDNLASGTLVMWENLDRVVGEEAVDHERSHKHFLAHVEDVRRHLAMTFHRFLSGSKPRLKIWINGRLDQHRVRAWDPFMEDHACTNRTPVDPVQFGGSIVSIRGYVLPHKDKLSPEEYDGGAGPKGWNAQQGFYIYRGDRMLVSGNWLKLGPVRPWAKEEHFKLARLSIDIPNSMDSEWSLDVKKSMAMPPANIRHKLMKLAEDVRSRARAVFVHRGEYGPRGNEGRDDLDRPWKSAIRGGRTVYKIRRDHVLVRGLLEKMGSLKPELESVFRLIEETVPVQQIWLDVAEKEHDHGVAYDGIDEAVVMGDMKKTWELLRASGYSEDEAKARIQSMEPFHRYPQAIEELS